MCKTLLLGLFSLNVVFTLCEVRSSGCLPSKSLLCKSMDIPCEPVIPATCQMKYYKLNSTRCRDLPFNDKLISQPATNDDLGKVELQSYYYNILSYKMTAFNITFSSIKWKHMKFRFRQVGNDMKNTCREFFITGNKTQNDLFYDCIWSNETYEGKPFFFEYEASNEHSKVYRKFSFHVPLAKNIDETSTQVQNWDVFTYVEAAPLSNGFGSTFFSLHWQPLPRKFLVNQYNVSIVTNDTGVPVILHSENIMCNDSRNCHFEYSKWYGSLQFIVQPICGNVTCSNATSLFFLVGGERTKPILIGMICASVIVPILFYLIFLLRKLMFSNQVTLLKPAPRLLVIYSPSAPFHLNVVLALVEYMKNHCNIQPLIDELDIFQSESRDPFKWCNNSFKSADIVMVVASPFHNQTRISSSVYQNTDKLLLRLLQERLAVRHAKTKYFVLMLPYTRENDIPCEAKNLRRFHFPRDLNKILKFIHENWIWPDIFGCKFQSSKEDYKLYGKKLRNAIDEAQYAIKNTKSECYVSGPDQANGFDVDSDHELLTLKKRDAREVGKFAIRNKESLRENAAEQFGDFPGPIENLNLTGDVENAEIDLGDIPLACQRKFHINQLDL